MITPEQLDGMRKRLANATPGPWRACGGYTPAFSAVVHSASGYIVFRMADGKMDKENLKLIPAPDYDQQKRNQSFIAHAPEDIAALLNEVDELRKDKERLDYIADNALSVCHNGRISAWVVQERSQVLGNIGQASTLRDAIDAARKELTHD